MSVGWFWLKRISFCFGFRWKERIDKAKTNAPFNKWAVACFLKDDDKAKALMR
jgi:hypothetical protein